MKRTNEILKIIFFASIIFLVGCDNTQEFLDELNQAPQINFMNSTEGPILRDSIKLGLKHSQEFYEVRFRVFDENDNIREVSFTQIAGIGTLYQFGIEIIDNNIKLESDVLLFKYFPLNLGLHKFRLTVSDNFDTSNSVEIELEAFNNLLPVANFNVQKLGQRSKREYKINASESYDNDQRFGGKISEYEYSVMGKIYSILSTELKVIFPETGVYTIGVRVKDNDGQWSNKKELDLSVD